MIQTHLRVSKEQTQEISRKKLGNLRDSGIPISGTNCGPKIPDINIIIENRKGIMAVLVELDAKFKTMLVSYYETNGMEELKQWVYDNCLDGIE